MKSVTWLEDAACRGKDPGLWFPSELKTSGPEFSPQGMRDAAEAKSYCQGCPVSVECLDYGLHEETGIYGGKTPRERRAIVRAKGRTRQPAQRPDKRCSGCGEWFTPDRDRQVACSRSCARSSAHWSSTSWTSARGPS